MTRQRRTFVAMLLVVLLAAAWFHLRPRQIVTEQIGSVRHYPAWPTWPGTSGFAYVFSGADGWSDADAQTARWYARHGDEVYGIDVGAYLQHLNSAGNQCLYLPGPLESWSRASQRQSAGARYAEPVLLGRAEGATLVYAAMHQAPPLAFGAAVGVDPTPAVPIHREFCNLASTRDPDGGARLPAEPLPEGTALALTTTASATPASAAFVAAVSRPGSDVGASAGTGLLDRYRQALERIYATRRNSDVADLPLVENAGTGRNGDAFAILYSGDGGWRDLDRSLAGVLAEKGMPVVGVDVLSYFWRRKSPEVAAADLARVIEYYAGHWHRQKVVMIGFSFGANVLPFLIEGLPSSTRQRIVLTSLLSPERSATFEINPGAWMGLDHSGDRTPIAPALATLDAGRLQCYFGEEERDDSLCTDNLPPNVEVIRKRGGHHFDRDYGELADEILMSIPNGAVAQGSPR